jgi:hypothetical protein
MRLHLAIPGPKIPPSGGKTLGRAIGTQDGQIGNRDGAIFGLAISFETPPSNSHIGDVVIDILDQLSEFLLVVGG